MSAITELLEHRTKLIAMKASILVDKRGGALYAAELNEDIEAVDVLIEKAITHSTNQPDNKQPEREELANHGMRAIEAWRNYQDDPRPETRNVFMREYAAYFESLLTI